MRTAVILSGVLLCGCATTGENRYGVADHPLNMIQPGESLATAKKWIGKRHFEQWRGVSVLENVRVYGVRIQETRPFVQDKGNVAAFVFENDVLIESKKLTSMEWIRVKTRDVSALPITSAKILERSRKIQSEAEDARIRYVENNPDLPKEMKEAIRAGKLRIGMRAEAAELVSGPPRRKNVTSGKFGTHEQWVYTGDRYLYFENGQLTSWQYSEGSY